MKKIVYTMLSLCALSISAFAIGADQQKPPITEGIGEQGSNTEIRVTANVVAGVAVNEGSPIDFGNLVRGAKVYKQGEIITERTPGLVEYRTDPDMTSSGVVKTKIQNNIVNLDWKTPNGSNGSGTVTVINNVTVTGIGTTWENVELDGNGEAKKTLHAAFRPYATAGREQWDTMNGNLGQNQKLGSYAGAVVVEATVL